MFLLSLKNHFTLEFGFSFAAQVFVGHQGAVPTHKRVIETALDSFAHFGSVALYFRTFSLMHALVSSCHLSSCACQAKSKRDYIGYWVQVLKTQFLFSRLALKVCKNSSLIIVRGAILFLPQSISSKDVLKDLEPFIKLYLHMLL